VTFCRARAVELVHNFDPRGVASIFSTHEQNRLANDYFSSPPPGFISSLKKMRFCRTPRSSKARQSINKIGHALHDLDPVFNEFSRTPELQQLAADLDLVDPLCFSRCTSSSNHESVAKSVVIRQRTSLHRTAEHYRSMSRWKMTTDSPPIRVA